MQQHIIPILVPVAVTTGLLPDHPYECTLIVKERGLTSETRGHYFNNTWYSHTGHDITKSVTHWYKPISDAIVCTKSELHDIIQMTADFESGDDVSQHPYTYLRSKGIEF